MTSKSTQIETYKNCTQIDIYRPVVFKWEQFVSPHPIIWQCLETFLVVPAEGCYSPLALVGRGHGCCLHTLQSTGQLPNNKDLTEPKCQRSPDIDLIFFQHFIMKMYKYIGKCEGIRYMFKWYNKQCRILIYR